MRTKSTPDVKEAYGKMKKEENEKDDKNSSHGQLAPEQKSPVTKFNNVAFLEEHGDKFWFFKTHVIPGNDYHYFGVFLM